jgi:hypothetical protein
MTFKPKLWLGVGAFALAGTVNPAAAEPAVDHDPTVSATPARAGSQNQTASHPVILAQLRGSGGEGGEGGEGGARGSRGFRPGGYGTKPKASTPQRQGSPHVKSRKKRGQGGEGGERGSGRRSSLPGGEGGEQGVVRVAGPGGEGGERGAVRRIGSGGEGGERGGPRLTGPGGEGGEAGVNTQYIFGFTEGADTERAGEREIENDATGRFAKRAGSYTALQNKTEFEYGVTNDLLFAFGSFLSYHRIRNVPELEDRNAVNFDGLSTELKYRILDRTTAPFGLAISAEPEWRRFSGTSGRHENSYAVELKLYADKELIPGKLFIAGNVLYEPEVVRVNEFDEETGRFKRWERESTLGFSGALSTALTDRVFLGGEVRYLSKYEGSFLNKQEGWAVFVGPTLSARVLPNAVLQAAYSVQVSGRAKDEPDRHLDLANFERHQGRLRFVYEF